MEIILKNRKNNLYSKSEYRQIVAIFLVEITSSIAFAVFFSSLSLFLTQSIGLSKISAAAITGVFLSFNYFLQLIGGIIANKLVTYKKLFLLGLSSSLVGCIILGFTHYLYLGLSLFLMSSLVTNVCLNMFITQIFRLHETKKRRIAFIWNYIGMNLGFMIGFFLTGLLSLYEKFSYIFIIMIFFILVTLTIVRKYINEPNLKKSLNIPIKLEFFYGISAIIFLTTLVDIVLRYAAKIEKYFLVFVVAISISILLFCFKKTSVEMKRNFKIYCYFAFIAIIYWSIYMLTPTAIMQFINNDVVKSVSGIKIAPQWFENIDSIIIILFGPLLGIIIKKIRHFSTINCFIFGLFFSAISISFIIFSLYIHPLNHKLPVYSIIAYLVFLTLGEMLISPTGNALVGELIEENYRGIITGVWSMTIGTGSIIASLIGKTYILPYVVGTGINPYIRQELIQNFSIIVIVVLFFVIVNFLLQKIY